MFVLSPKKEQPKNHRNEKKQGGESIPRFVNVGIIDKFVVYRSTVMDDFHPSLYL